MNLSQGLTTKGFCVLVRKSPVLAWRCMLESLIFRKLRQEDCEIKAILVNLIRPYLNFLMKRKKTDCTYSSWVGHLPSMHEALGSIFSITYMQKKKKIILGLWAKGFDPAAFVTCNLKHPSDSKAGDDMAPL